MAEDKEKEQLHRATAKYSKARQKSSHVTFLNFGYRDLLIGELVRHG